MVRDVHFFYAELREVIYSEAEAYADFGIELVYSPGKVLGKCETPE